MPFDGVGYSQSEPLRKLDAVINLLDAPEKWCKGALKSQDGRYCLRGAVMSVGATDLLEPAILQAICEVTGRTLRRIESFNDYPSTTHEQVVAVLERTRDILLDIPAKPGDLVRLRPRERVLAGILLLGSFAAAAATYGALI